MPPDINDEERQEKLPEDYDTPFSPAPPSRDDATPPDSVRQEEEDHFDDTHPDTDSNLDSQELYDEGVSGAAEASEPNAGDAVVNYNPPTATDDDTDDTDDPESEDADMPKQPS